jgi:hypothetical protein
MINDGYFIWLCPLHLDDFLQLDFSGPTALQDERQRIKIEEFIDCSMNEWFRESENGMLSRAVD